MNDHHHSLVSLLELLETRNHSPYDCILFRVSRMKEIRTDRSLVLPLTRQCKDDLVESLQLWCSSRGLNAPSILTCAGKSQSVPFQ